MTSWVIKNKTSIIRNSFLVPILLVVIMSISHVVSWYQIGNPISWSIYLSVAIEIFALASVSASTLKISKGAIWFLFCLVTLIQIVGNVFFEYTYIKVEEENFKSWLELISPIVDDWGVIEHRRLLALIQGGTLPIMSLTSLHFYIKFNEEKKEVKESSTSQQPDYDDYDEVMKEFVYVDSEMEEMIREQEKDFDIKHTSVPKDKIDNTLEKVQNEGPTELQLARNYWGKTNGAFDGVSKTTILEHYNKNYKKKSNT